LFIRLKHTGKNHDGSDRLRVYGFDVLERDGERRR
jgi:hypothetical protein